MSSDKATDVLNKLLEEGFHISEILHEMNDKKFKTTVKVRKGSEDKVISSEDPEFFKYIVHFHRESDGYGNSVFVYSDDAQQSGNVKPPSNRPLRSVYIEIGDRLLTNDIMITLVQSPGPGVPSAKAIFYVKPSSNPDFEFIDARDNLKIFDNATRRVIYKGLINRISFGKDSAYFECETAPRTLTTQQVNMELLHFNRYDALYFIIKKTGLTLNAPPDVKINLTERNFIVIVPIKNLVLEGNFEFAGVEFRSVFDTKDDMIIRKSKMCQREADWGSNYVRARVTVKSTNHFDALKMGYSKIQSAMNWIIFRNDLTFPVINDKTGKIFSSYDFFKHYSRIHISSMAYCREINRESTCIFDTRELLGNQLVIQSNPDDYFTSTKSICEKIFVKDSASLLQIEKNILLSFHWISRTIIESNNVDKLLDLWTAIELIVLRSATHNQFNDLEIKIMLKRLSSLNYSGTKLEILKEKINLLNSPPIMTVISDTVQKLGLSISPNEWVLLRLTRKKRNDIIHGKKDWEVTDEEIEKLRGFVERILIAIVNRLEFTG